MKKIFVSLLILIIFLSLPFNVFAPTNEDEGLLTKTDSNKIVQSTESPGDGSQIKTPSPTAISPSKGPLRTVNLPSGSYAWSDSQGFHASAVDNLVTRKGVELQNAKGIVVNWNNDVSAKTAEKFHVPGADIKNAENINYDPNKKELTFSKAEKATAYYPRSNIPHIKDGKLGFDEKYQLRNFSGKFVKEENWQFQNPMEYRIKFSTTNPTTGETIVLDNPDQDSNGDGLSDMADAARGGNTKYSDFDNDGLTNYDEVTKYSTNLAKKSTNEGYEDSEYIKAVEKAVSEGKPVYVDGKNIVEELKLQPDNAFIDTDADGLSDIAEYIKSSNPNKYDTDEDGFGDGYEISHGLNPLSKDDFGIMYPDTCVQCMLEMRGWEGSDVMAELGDDQLYFESYDADVIVGRPDGNANYFKADTESTGKETKVETTGANSMVSGGGMLANPNSEGIASITVSRPGIKQEKHSQMHPAGMTYKSPLFLTTNLNPAEIYISRQEYLVQIVFDTTTPGIICNKVFADYEEQWAAKENMLFGTSTWSPREAIIPSPTTYLRNRNLIMPRVDKEKIFPIIIDLTCYRDGQKTLTAKLDTSIRVVPAPKEQETDRTTAKKAELLIQDVTKQEIAKAQKVFEDKEIPAEIKKTKEKKPWWKFWKFW